MSSPSASELIFFAAFSAAHEAGLSSNPCSNLSETRGEKSQQNLLHCLQKDSEGQTNQSQIKMTLHENSHFTWIHINSSLSEHWCPASQSKFVGQYLQVFYNQLLKFPPGLFSAHTHSSHSIQNAAFLAVSHSIIYFSRIANHISSCFGIHVSIKSCRNMILLVYNSQAAHSSSYF